MPNNKRTHNIVIMLQFEKDSTEKSGDPGGNRTCNCSLGGSRYIHLTTGPNFRILTIRLKFSETKRHLTPSTMFAFKVFASL